MSRKKKIFLIRPIEPNRGDIMSRYGLLKQVARTYAPDQVVVLSERPASELPAPFIIVRPGPLKDLIPRWKQIRLYSRSDEVWWTCGHDIQDDSSLLKLPFLIFKFLFFKLMGLKVKIIAQGAGPISTRLGKWCVKNLMALVQSASFRDSESLTLIQRLAPKYQNKLSLTVDCALHASNSDNRVTEKQSGKPFLLGVNLRRWFHFDGHWMPYEYRVKMGLVQTIPGQDKMNHLVERMAGFLDHKIERDQIRVRLIPMYPPNIEPWEDDLALLRELKSKMTHRDQVEIIDGDLSPEKFLEIFRDLDAMIGVRLHSTIISTMLSVPSIHLGYSPKGFSYFKRIGQEEYAIPLDHLLNESGWSDLEIKFEQLVHNRSTIHNELLEKISEMRESSHVPL